MPPFPESKDEPTMSRNEDLFSRAQKTIPGGVNSPVRAFRSVGGAPRFFRAAKALASGMPTARPTSTTSVPGAR
jgi:hypothetical protein